MIRIETVQNELLKVVGWNDKNGKYLLPVDLVSSESGMFYQQAHPLLTLENIKNIAPEFKSDDIQPYSEEVEYKKDSLVMCDEVIYKALKGNVGIECTNTECWEPTTQFAEWLLDKTKASIQKAVFRIVNEKTLQGTNKNLCESKVLFESTGRICDKVQNMSRFVGFEITPVRAKSITTVLNRVSLQFSKKGAYKLFIFNSDVSEPIYTIELTKTKDNSAEWFSLKNIELPFTNDSVSGGSWYIGYFQDDLPEGSEAIRKDRDWSKGPCSSCSRTEMIAWTAWSKYLEMHPFYVPGDSLTANDPDVPMLWDIEDNIYDYTNNFGLNLDITVACDITDFIVTQRASLADIMMKQLAVDMLREFAFNASVRTNRHSLNASRLDIMYELDGDSSSLKKSGLNYQLDVAIGAYKLSLNGLDRVCMPCKNNGVKYRTT